MAVNENGNLVDDAGNVAVDFVWGNFPLQPNDVRVENGGAVLDFALDNHVIAEAGWNGYPLYTPNTDGEFVSGVAYATVPNLVGKTEARATALLVDAGLVIGTVTTTATGATADNNGKVKTQSIAAGADSIALGTAVNAVLYAYVAP
jgi:hypothetical protein